MAAPSDHWNLPLQVMVNGGDDLPQQVINGDNQDLPQQGIDNGADDLLQQGLVNGGDDLPQQGIVNSDDENQPQQGIVDDNDDFSEELLPQIVEDVQGGERTAEGPLGRRRPRRPAPTLPQLCLRALHLCRRLLWRLLEWFGARPLGQRALSSVGRALTAAEQATVWAGCVDAQSERQPIPFVWYFMVPIIISLMVIRTGAALAERCLDLQLPDNKSLVSWLDRQRGRLEQLQTIAAWNIRVETINENDPMYSFMNTWPLCIPYQAAQQLGIIPVQVPRQPSHTDSTSIAPVEPSATPSSSASTLSEDMQEEEEPIAEELTTPPPEVAAGDKSMYFSPDGDTQTMERSGTEEQQDKQEEEEEEEAKAKGKQAGEELPTITAEDAEKAVATVVQPEPLAPPQQLVTAEEMERAALSVLPPPARPASSQDLLAAEGASQTEPTTSTSTTTQATPKPTRGMLFLNLFGAKLG